MKTPVLDARPAFMDRWPTAYPRRSGQWTVAGPGGTWGLLDPEAGTASVVDPCRDSELPAIAHAAERGNLIGYRAGRRAIIATPDSFIKVVRPGRLDGLEDNHVALGASGTGLSLPRVLDSGVSGWLDLTRVPGLSLHQRLRSHQSGAAVLDALDHIGTALAAFHSAAPPPNLAPRSLDHPRRWIETVNQMEPEIAAELVGVAAGLPRVSPAAHTLVHGDLHDKNVFTSTSGVGLIDLDGVGLGAAEDDIANLAVHLQLRALQAGRRAGVGKEHAHRLYGAYQLVRPLDAERLDAVERHTWFRLACLYRFRVASRHLGAELLRRATGHHG